MMHLIRLACVVGAASGLLASTAHAQLAVVPAIADGDVAQRALVAEVVEAVAARWALLAPQLDPAQVATCAPRDIPCVQRLARGLGATHVLVVGVGSLTLRDHLVSVRLYDIEATEPLFKESVRQAGVDERPEALLTLVRARLLELQGLPLARPAPATPPAAASSERSTLAAVLLASGAAVLGLVAGGALALAAEEPAPALALATGGAVAGIALGAAGAAVMLDVGAAP